MDDNNPNTMRAPNNVMVLMDVVVPSVIPVHVPVPVPHHERSRTFQIACVFTVGFFVPVQAGINIRLAASLGHGLRGALVSFAVGTLLLLILNSFVRKPPLKEIQCKQTKWWMFSGGAPGCFFVCSGIFLAPIVGFSFFFTMVVGGQLVCSLILDNVGFLGYQVRKVTKQKVLGTLLTLAGCIMVQDFRTSKGAGYMILYALVSFFAGAALPFQTSINKRLAEQIKHPLRSALVSFTGGTCILLVLSAISLAFVPLKLDNSEPYHWIGGVVGAIFVTSSIVFTRLIGVTVFYVCIVAAQLTSSLILDATGAFGPVVPATALRAIGIFTAFAGAAIVSGRFARGKAKPAAIVPAGN